jgi:hypothetical protein
MKRNSWKSTAVFLALFVGLAFSPITASAHCDGMDGPVVKAAQQALATSDVDFVLVWVQASDESEIRQAFEHTLAIRKLGLEAQELADRYFFETLVRIHRAGEGAPYTGLKSAGRDLVPAIPAADRALQDRSAESLLILLGEAVQDGVREHFQEALQKSNYNKSQVRDGRAYVQSYVEYIHYVERIYEAATNPAPGHFAEHEE